MKKLESLKNEKFNTLENSQMAQLKGGRQTGGDVKPTKVTVERSTKNGTDCETFTYEELPMDPITLPKDTTGGN